MNGSGDNPMMSTAAAILVCMLDDRPDDARLLAGSVDPGDHLTLIEAFAKSWCWTVEGALRARGHTRQDAHKVALSLAQRLTLNLAGLEADEYRPGGQS